MLMLCLLCSFVATLIHLFIFYLEVLRYGSPKFQQIFRLPENDLPKVKTAFNNLGIYNLSLAISSLIGTLMLMLTQQEFALGIAIGLLYASLGSMVLAGVYLAYSQSDKYRAAAIQAIPPLLALLCLISST